MTAIGQFEEEWESLKADCEYGSLDYNGQSASACKIIRGHFCNIRRQQKYGVYVVRRQATREVLYIGKGGTIK